MLNKPRSFSLHTVVFFLLFLFTSLSTFGQTKPQDCDLIVFKNGKDIEAKVTEITSDEVKYKKCNNQDGPTYIASKKELFKIKYQNGENEMFTEYVGETKDKNKETDSEKQKGRIFSFGPDAAFDGDLYLGPELSIEWMNGKRNVGFRITSIVLFRGGDYHSTNTLFLTKFYLNKGKGRFFLGPGVFTGISSAVDDNDYEDEGGGYIGLAGTMGVSIDPGDNVNITIHTNSGLVLDSYGDIYPVALLGVSLGFRF